MGNCGDDCVRFFLVEMCFSFLIENNECVG